MADENQERDPALHDSELRRKLDQNGGEWRGQLGELAVAEASICLAEPSCDPVNIMNSCCNSSRDTYTASSSQDNSCILL